MKKISQKISLLLIILTLVSFVGIFFRVSFLMRETLVEFEQASMTEVNQGNAWYIETRMEGYGKALWILSEDLENRLDGDREEIFESLENFAQNFPSVQHVYVGTTAGEFILNTRENFEGFDPRTRDWYIEASQGKDIIWTDPYIDFGSKKVTISAAFPVFDDESGALKGVAGFDVLLEGLSTLMEEIRIGTEKIQGKKLKGGVVYIVDENGTIVAHRNQELLGEKIDAGLMAKFIEMNGSADYETDEGKQLFTYTRFGRKNWVFISQIPYGDIYKMVWSVSGSVIVFGILSSIVAIIVGIYFSNRISRPITVMEKNMRVVKDGDLRVDMKVFSEDEVGVLAKSFNEMMSKVKVLIADSISVSERVLRSSEELADFTTETSVLATDVTRTIGEIAEGATEQATETESGVRLSGALSDKFDQLVHYSASMSESATSVKNISKEGALVVGELREMSAVSKESNDRVERAIIELDENTVSIQGILETIKSIAAQTNLLALNASIEAARAGEVGRGFAVVADEIRKLAEGSDTAVSEIGEILSKTQADSKNTVSIMNEVKDIHVKQQVSVERVSETFQEVFNAIEQIVGQIHEMSNQVDHIKQDKDDIVTSMEIISGISEETAAGSQEVTATMIEQSNAVEKISIQATALNAMARELMDKLSHFKI